MNIITFGKYKGMPVTRVLRIDQVTLDGARTMYVGSNSLKETTKYTWNGYHYSKIIYNSRDILMIWVILDSFLEKWKKASLMLTLIQNILLKRRVVNI